MNTKPYLLDKDFLRELDSNHDKVVYAKITSLTFDESQIEEIQGQATGGSINIDGASAVRRTCSISLVAKDVNINDIYWGLNTKFKLEIGLRNKIDSRYPEIIWFPQGIFLITGFSQSLSANSYTINISGKDKMVLLNGEISGTINANSWDFGTKDNIAADGTVTNVDIPLTNIIRDAVHEFAKEPYENILINDMKDGIELLEYRADRPMYLIINNSSRESVNSTFDGNTQVFVKNSYTPIALKDFEARGYHYDDCIDLDLSGVSEVPPTVVYLSAGGPTEYTIAKMEYGHTVGYRQTELTYPGDLVVSTGGSVTSMLDKLVGMLGEYEYFYDVYGKFHFQRKKNWINTSFNNIIDTRDEIYATNVSETSAVTYNFENSALISSFQNTPALNELRNDYSVWGTKTSVTGQELPVHLRYAIDKKPKYYKNFKGEVFATDSYASEFSGVAKTYDWRELIYQMALDYNKHHFEDNFLITLANNNRVDKESYYPTGLTGYEQYYVDVQGFWRQLYCPEPYVKWLRTSKTKLPPHGFYIKKNGVYSRHDEFDANFQYYITAEDAGFNMTNPQNLYWSHELENPEQLNFWFDFLDSDAIMNKYAVYAIGDRSKALNDKDVKAIYFRETPTAIFIDPKSFNKMDRLTGYTYMQCPAYMEPLFKMSAQGKSAKDVLDQELYNHSYCIESVSLTTIPIYYLEPNTRIFIKDDITGIVGEYIMRSMSLQLSYNGTMNISATKAPEKLY